MINKYMVRIALKQDKCAPIHSAWDTVRTMFKHCRLVKKQGWKTGRGGDWVHLHTPEHQDELWQETGAQEQERCPPGPSQLLNNASHARALLGPGKKGYTDQERETQPLPLSVSIYPNRGASSTIFLSQKSRETGPQAPQEGPHV